MEQLHYNLLYRWFVGLGADESVWVPTVFTKNRERLLQAEVAHKFLAELLNHKEVRGLLSDEHSSVDGTQVAGFDAGIFPDSAEGRESDRRTLGASRASSGLRHRSCRNQCEYARRKSCCDSPSARWPRLTLPTLALSVGPDRETGRPIVLSYDWLDHSRASDTVQGPWTSPTAIGMGSARCSWTQATGVRSINRLRSSGRLK
jgi:hypothetical protein